MAPTKCNACKATLTKVNSGVTCAQCKKSFHWNCGNLSNKIVQDITNGTITQWKCSDCDKRKSAQFNDSSATAINDNNNLSIQRINDVVLDMQKYFNEKFGELQEVTKVLNDYGARINQLEDDGKTLQFNLNDLDVRVDNIEQAALLNSIEINGIPLTQPDNPADLICKIGSIISYATTSEDWSHIYRLHRQTNQDNPPSIIVFFKELSKRNGFLSAAKAHRGITTTNIGLNGTDKLIYVNEHLTKARKKLFYTAKSFKTKNNYKYLWTNKGRIYLRKNDGSQAISVNFYTNFAKLDGGM